jgi:hypothetical protein
MMDTCTLRILSVTLDDYGEEVEAFAETAGVACGLDVTGGIAANEATRANGAITTISAALRLSLDDGDGLTEEDRRITVTHRNGERSLRRWPTASTAIRGAGRPATRCACGGALMPTVRHDHHRQRDAAPQPGAAGGANAGRRSGTGWKRGRAWWRHIASGVPR